MTFTGTRERIVNQKTTLFQREASVAALENGGFVTSWSTYGNASYWDQRGIYFRPFEASNQPVGGDETAHGIIGRPKYSDVSGLKSGGWVVAYQSDEPGGQSGDEISFGIYSQNGKLVNDLHGIKGFWGYYSYNVQAEALDDGGFILSWTASKLNKALSYDVFQTRFDKNGKMLMSPDRINADQKGEQLDTALCASQDSGWVVAWSSGIKNEEGYYSSGDVYLSRYNKSGNAIIDQLVVSQNDDHLSHSADVAALSDGRMLVTWSSLTGGRNKTDLKQQLVSDDGKLIGDPAIVNTTLVGQQRVSVVTALNDGGWVIAWESQVGKEIDIYMQRYDAFGKKSGIETLVNQHTNGPQVDPSIATLSDGSFVITWTSPYKDGQGTEISERRFSPNFIGSYRNESAIGTDVADKLFGGGGDDTINGKMGNDQLTGGTGNDTFVFEDNFGTDTIRDFQKHRENNEVIDLHLISDALTFAEIKRSSDQFGDNTLISLQGVGVIKLVEFSIGDLHRSDFIL